MIEVEVKYRLADPAELESRLLRDCHGSFLRDEQHEDLYFRHPVRDFKITDEALRIRTCGDESRLCYKGPRLDTVTGTRRELECGLEGDPKTATQLLQEVGFSIGPQVTKRRRLFTAAHGIRRVTVAFDQVEGLGSFVELEILCDAADRESATEDILKFAEFLKLREPERSSYVELLESQGNRYSSPGGDQLPGS